MNSRGSRFSTNIKIRSPKALPAAVTKAADKHLMTPSEYMRRAIMKALKADGIDPTAIQGAA